MPTRAKGPFDVTIKPEPLSDSGEGGIRGRASLEKRFRGDLEGASIGEMLTAVTAVKGSAGYVAIERVTGTLHGRTGTFILQHSGTMTRGKPELAVSVVPDSGTAELAGLAGKMTIDIVEGKHFYTLDYVLEASA